MGARMGARRRLEEEVDALRADELGEGDGEDAVRRQAELAPGRGDGTVGDVLDLFVGLFMTLGKIGNLSGLGCHQFFQRFAFTFYNT